MVLFGATVGLMLSLRGPWGMQGRAHPWKQATINKPNTNSGNGYTIPIDIERHPISGWLSNSVLDAWGVGGISTLSSPVNSVPPRGL